MKIAGITTCVDYADHLSRGLSAWRDGLDSLIVVTNNRDADTVLLCIDNNVRFHCTNAFAEGGAAFNKSAAMEEAIGLLPWQDWFLFFDADVVPPDGWRQCVEQSNVLPNTLYGARRVYDDGHPLADGELAGFFQLWHADDPAVETRPLLGSWHNASGYDSQFIQRWPASNRVILPLTLTHYGRPGENWCGRGNAIGMRDMQVARQERRGWQHERLS